MASGSRVRGIVSKYLRFPSLQRETASASPLPRHLRASEVERLETDDPTPTAAAPARELKTTLGLSFGAAIAIFGLLNSTATKASPDSLLLLVAALMISFSASLIGISIPRIAQVMEPVAVVCIAVSFYMIMGLMLSEEKRWVAPVVGTLVLVIFLGPSVRKVYDRIRLKLRGNST